MVKELKVEWKSCFRIGVSIFLLFLCIHYWASVSNFVLLILGAGFPLLIGAGIAYLINILMSFYEKHYFSKKNNCFVTKTRRPVCMLGAFLTMLAIIALLVSIVVPQLISCVQLIFAELPRAVESVITRVNELNIVPDDISSVLVSVDWEARMGQIFNLLTNGVGGIMDTAIKAISAVFSGAVTALLSLIFAIYLLIDRDKLKEQTNNLMEHYLSVNWCNKIRYFFSILNDCFHRYIVGQCTEAVILGLLCTLGMMILKIPYAAMIGALIAFTALIPIAGAYIGAGVGAFMIFTVSPMQALVFLIFIVVLQQLEGNLIYPRVVGSSIGLPGIWVLAAVTIGGGIMGITGMLFGVPLTATFYRIVCDDMKNNESKNKKSRKVLKAY